MNAEPPSFIRQSPALNKPAPGLEANAAPGATSAVESPPAAPDDSHRHRARDLFIRGVLSKEKMERACASIPGFEAIIGKADYLPAVFLEQGARISRATCLISASGIDYLNRSGSWSGTGFLISPNILVTNNHVINSLAVAQAGSALFNYQVDANGAPAATKSYRLRPDLLFITSPAIGGLDYTFVGVEGSPGDEFATVVASRSTFGIAPNEYANVISHPGGRMKLASIKENEVKWQDEVVVHYASDTEGGSSGAPVSNNNWQLIALHHASQPTTAVPGFPVLNEGIKFSAIAADLERRSAAGGSDSAAARRTLGLFGGTDERLGFFGALGRPGAAGRSALERVVDAYQGTDLDIDVGFWNVEWLSNRYENKAAAVAQVIFDMRLDIWCLVESSPNGVQAVVNELKEAYGLDFAWDAAEPDTHDNKQSCTMLWNKATVHGEKVSWGEPIETWLQTGSRDFGQIGLEAVHGKIFDRYPALYHFTTVQDVQPGRKLDFHVVPLHLKARDEGSLRRSMAARILAAAVKRRIEDNPGADTDYIIGGDFNAELASGDFDALDQGGLRALSTEDEREGAITYIKRPYLSLIDHIYLSPNLSDAYGSDSFFIVASESQYPEYIRNISDHRPIIFRMSLNPDSGPGGNAQPDGQPFPALDELKQALNAAPGDSMERRRRRGNSGGAEHLGFTTGFLGVEFAAPPPGLGFHENDVTVVNAAASGLSKHLLDYVHYSVVMCASRRLPFYSAVNINGALARSVSRDDGWKFDPRIPESAQTGNSVYANNDLDRGHMTRRLDPVWGDEATASRANSDTFFYTNSCPQHKDLNQKEWLKLEDYILNNAKTRDLKVSVFTGPVFGARDIEYRGVRIPEEFWKIAVIVNNETGRLSATGYVLSQRDMLSPFEFVYGKFKTYQVPLSRIAALTGLDLGQLPAHDPFAGIYGQRDGLETRTLPLRGKLLSGMGDIIL